jgi:hypothetical protein
MKYSSSFSHDLNFGEKAEDWLNNLFNNGKLIEVKSDRLIHKTGNLYIDANGGYGLATIFRGATNLVDATYGMSSVYGASSTVIGSMSMSVLDSPSTTSATTYQVYIKRYGGNNVYIQEPLGKSSITAFEIAG